MFFVIFATLLKHLLPSYDNRQLFSDFLQNPRISSFTDLWNEGNE